MTAEERLEATQKALKAGRKGEAARLLQQWVQQTPNDYRPWLLLAGLAPTAQDSLDCVARAERLKPGDLTIQRARHLAEKRVAGKAIPPAPPLPADPIDQLRHRAMSRPERPRSKPWPTILVTSFIVIMLIGLITLTAFMIGGPADSNQTIANAQPTATLTPVNNYHFVPAGTANTPLPTLTIQPLQPKNIVNTDNTPRPTWTTTPPPTNTPSPTPTPYPTILSPDGESLTLPPINLNTAEKWVDVDLSSQTLIAYEGLTPVFETLISSGLPAYPTVTGQFRVWLRYESQTMDGSRLGYDYYLENVPYVMYFYQDYALHGTFWHNNFGHPMSHGCVNMATPDAEWMFNWSALGTLVNVHN